MNNNKMYSENLLLKSLLTLLILSVTFLSFFNIPTTDDFLIASALRNSSIFDFIWRFYFNWTGRVLPSFILVLSIQEFTYFYVIAFLLILSFMLIPILLIKIVEGKLFLKHWLFSLFVFEFLFLFGFRDYLGENVFWITGGVMYVLCLFLCLLWLFFYIKYLKEGKTLVLVLTTLSGILVGISHEQLVAFLLISFSFLLHLKYFNLKKENLAKTSNLKLILPLFSLTLGFAALILAPGNYTRAKLVSITSNDLASMTENFVKLGTRLFTQYGIDAILAASVLGLIIGIANFQSSKDTSKYKISLAISLISLASGLLTLAPMVRYPAFETHRTFFFGVFFIFISTVTLVYSLTDFLLRIISARMRSILKYDNFYFPASVFRYSIIVAIMVFGSTIIYQQYDKAIPFKKRWVQRNEYFEGLSSSYADSTLVKVEPFLVENPSWFHFHDITADTNHFINRGVVTFYKLGNRQIILDEFTKSDLDR